MTSLLALAACSPLHAQAATAQRGARDLTPLVRHIEALATRVVNEQRVTGMAITIVHRDRVLLERGFGVTEAGKREAVDADTVFRLASLSKAFAGTLTALLVQDGRLRWDTLIASQLPTFKLKDIHAAERLTVRDILSHRVGLPFNTYDRDLEADQPYPLLAAKLAQAPTSCTPGDCYAYQNIAFSLIGDMVFAVTGEFYSYQVERRIFHPLGMYTATFGRDALEASARWARPHVRRGSRWVAVRPKESYYRIPPAAGVNASVRDLSLWLIAQTGGRPEVLSDEVLTQTHTSVVATPGERRGVGWRGARIRDAGYAAGWRVFDYAGERLVFHAGAVQGYRAMLGFLPDHDFGVAILWNCESAAPSGLFPTALDRFLGLPSQDWTGLERAPRRRR